MYAPYYSHSLIGSLIKTHLAQVAECEAEETCDPNERDCDDDLVLYAGQRGALPWIISGEEDSDLRSEVMALSVREATFRDGAAEGYGICVTQRKALILELLALDPNLKSMHAKLSTRLRESVFWTNYFYHCAALRRRRKAERCRSSRSDLPTHLETTLAVSVLPSGAGINAPSVSAKDDDDAAVPRTDEATPDRTDLLPILSATDVVAPLTTDEDTIPGTEETKVFSTSSVNLSAPNLATLLISDHGTPPAIEESTLPTAHKSNPREIGISGENLGAESADDDEDLDSWLDDDE